MDKNKKEKKTFLEWIDNIWYYYKWYIIVGIFGAIMLGVACKQQLTKVSPDAFVYYVGQKSPTAQCIDEFCNDLQDMMPLDYNGDGKKKVDYKEDIFIRYTTEVQPTESGDIVFNQDKQLDIVERFNMELAVGECLIYIMDDRLFANNVDYIAPLEDVLGYVPKNAIDGKGIRIKNLKAYRTTGLKYFPEDCVICMRAKRSGDKQDFYESNRQTFKALVEYR